MLKKLTGAEIEKLSSRKDVQRDAVENFLATVEANHNVTNAVHNLAKDAILYCWNEETVNAMIDGIALAS